MRWDPGRRTPEDHHDIVAEEKQICDEAPSASGCEGKSTADEVEEIFSLEY
jgi:hypothetical protein